MREYIAELQSERRWEQLEQSHYEGLGNAARLAKQQIVGGQTSLMGLGGFCRDFWH
ncbi:MAG: hypothetical protein AAGJ35_08300 [Myxococcota bacterium]